MKRYFCVGTYTEPILFGTGQIFEGKGEGLYLCSFESGGIRVEGVVPLCNPSFFCIDEKRRRIYTVNETKTFQGHPGGGVTELTWEKLGRIEERHSACTGGEDPCHLAISPDGSFLAVANFAGGSVTTFRLSDQGDLLSGLVYRHSGRSVHPVRQRSPHAHSVVFDGYGQMLVPDLGADRLYVYKCRAGGLCEEQPEQIPLKGGSGPRYGEYSPDRRYFYLINELASSVTRFTCEGGKLQAHETVETLPAELARNNICSDLHLTPDGKYLYASNRGDDSLSLFSVDRESGRLTPLGRIPCGGKTPRNFCVDPSGAYLLVGNQESDTITVFSLGEDGMLSEINRVAFPSPVCIRFFEPGP